MKKFKSYILVAMMGLTVTSCEDFLTLMPLNEVVLENFWKDEKDVKSVLMGAYASLESSDCITRMVAWGEMRSDNIVPGVDNSSSSDDELIQFINENFNSKNALTKYLCFYKTINYANTVLHYAPEVKEKDPNFHGGELAATEAEAIAIRSLCYWYLIRAFKDVPYVTRPSIDDTEDFFIGKTDFDVILESLISDLEKYKPYAQTHYSGILEDQENSARFTSMSIDAMLADMYLWKGDWEKCIKCCEDITAKKITDYKKIKAEKGLDCTIELILDKYPLISETIGGSDICGNAYNEIFGTGHSFETLFELPFDRNRENPFISDYYNSQSSSVGRLKAASKISRSDGDAVFNNKNDVRYYQNIAESGSSDKGIVKYVYSSMEYNMKSGGDQTDVGTRRSDSYSNWIVYRYTDVLLMEAEAYVMWANETSNADSSNLFLKNAFDLVDAVNRRAICYSRYGSTPLDFSKYNTVSSMEDLVFDERRRELMFEGKRWFDLVRRAMREGNSDYLSQKVVGKNTSGANSNAITIKFKNLNGLFLPINFDEIKINEYLKQNPAYSESEHIKKAQ